jgi:HSP20 family protein
MKPAMDIAESEDELTISVELPGLKKDDVKLSIENGVLTLSGEKRFESEEKKQDYHRVERSYGSFHRSISLPSQMDAANAEASFEDGVLEIRIPRAETAKPKQIEIG